MKIIFNITLLTTFILLQGCQIAAREPFPFDQKIYSQINSSRLVIKVNSEISREFKKASMNEGAALISSLAMGPLIFIGGRAAIDEHKQSNANSTLKDINLSVDKDTIERIIANAIYESINEMKWLNLKEVVVDKTNEDDLSDLVDLDRSNNINKTDVTIYALCNIKLSRDLSKLKVEPRIAVIPNKKSLYIYNQVKEKTEINNLMNGIYLNTIHTSVDLFAERTTQKTNLKLLEENGSEQLISSIKLIVEQLKAMIKQDFEWFI